MDDFLLFLQMRHYILLTQPFAVILSYNWRVCFVHCVYRINYVIVEHEVFEVNEGSDFLILIDWVDDFLVLSEHVVLDDLLAHEVNYFIVVDTVSGRVQRRVLHEPKPSLERQFDSIEKLRACLIEHWFSFLLIISYLPSLMIVYHPSWRQRVVFIFVPWI